ncbi:MAG TPA: tetratricopeptide repeat protein [Polyangia bacterium]|nr:tetratricopeptide repeat protein [Polyangia bacterium]
MSLSLPLAVLLATFAAVPTGAPTADEQRLFAEGQRALEAGKPDDAITAWKAGYQLRRDPAFLVRIGEAHEKAGAPPAAAESYRRYLHEAPDAADRAEIEQRISRLNPGIVPPRPAESPGAPEVPGNFPGTAGTPGATPAAPAPPPASGPGLAVPATDEETARRAAAKDDTDWNFARATAWISVALTAGLLGVAGFYGASAASKKDDVNRLLTYRDQQTNVPLEYSSVAQQYQDAFREGRRDDSRAKLMLVLAGGTAAVATTFFILDKTRTSRPEIALYPDGARLGLFGSWRWRF